MAELARLRALVKGRVQGVSFRFFVVGRARALGVSGYVSNLADGSSVMVEAEGERDRLERLVKELYRGPRGARVEQVEVAWSEHQGAFQGFGIRR